MLQIQDLATIELLTIDRPMIDRIQGGLGFSILETVIMTGTTELTTQDSLYQLFDNGFSSVSTFTMVKSTPDSSMSMISTSSMLSIG